MRLDLKILGLPASILFLIASHITFANASQDEQSAAQLQNLPVQAKRWPEDSLHRRQQQEAVEEHLRLGRSPVGVMKMSPDEGEKFYMDYWQFEGELDQSRLSDTSTALRGRDEEEEARLLANASAAASFRPPFALHTKEGSDPLSYEDLRARKAIEGRNAAAVLAALEKRGFVCPTGTSDCSAINYPNSCCATGETCFAIQDTGLGPVGCCPNGSNCGGTIIDCNAPNTACADNLGGGCCIPNYVCAGVGCVINPTLVVMTVITRTFTASASSSITQTTTVVSTLTSSISTTTTTSTDSQTSSASTTATAIGVAPVRPTSDTPTTTQTTTGPATLCPTGFYACSAYYAGGCCRTGRNCDTTSCPATSSTTIISSGVTVVVPVGPAATLNSPTGNCATGWATCDPTLGGNCCPSGWQCGTASCSSPGATATEYLQKASPNDGVKNRGIGGFGVVMTLMLGLIMM